METKPIASNESVAAELRKLQTRNFTISRCIGFPNCDGDLPGEEHSKKCPESKMPSLPEKWVRLSELEPLIARLEAPGPALEAPRTEPLPDVPLGERAFPRQGWRAVAAIPDPALEELRQAARDEALRACAVIVRKFNFMCCSDADELERQILAKLSQPSGQPAPIITSVEQLTRDEALREVENAISYFFDTHKGMINTNVACDTLLGRVKALAKFSQPSGKPEKAK